MLVGGLSTMIASVWASMANWSTPTLLFCLLNLTIATIFIASNFKYPNHHQHDRPSQLTRSPSLLERVKSINLSSYYRTQEAHVDQYNVHSEGIESLQSSELTRAPSLLDRVKSFKLASFGSDKHLGEKSSSQDECSSIDSDHDSVEVHNVTSDHLLRKPDMITPVKRAVSGLAKSGSEKRGTVSKTGEEEVYKRQPATMKAAAVEVHDESVDAKADDFINRFKQQLKLQRIDSLQRWRKMLNRETSSA